MSQRTEIYTLTGKKIGVITEGVPEKYTLTGKKLVVALTDKKPDVTLTDKKNEFDKKLSK